MSYSCPYCNSDGDDHQPYCPHHPSNVMGMDKEKEGWKCPTCGKNWAPDVLKCDCEDDIA